MVGRKDRMSCGVLWFIDRNRIGGEAERCEKGVRSKCGD